MLAKHKTKPYNNRWLYFRVILRNSIERSKFLIRFRFNGKAKKSNDVIFQQPIRSVPKIGRI